MQFVDNDMDELFRQAAEHYPLRTDGADWNKVAQELQQDEPKPPAGSGRKQWLGLVALLMALLIICTTYINRSVTGDGKGNTQVSKSTSSASSSGKEQSAARPTSIPAKAARLQKQQQEQPPMLVRRKVSSGMADHQARQPFHKLKAAPVTASARMEEKKARSGRLQEAATSEVSQHKITAARVQRMSLETAVAQHLVPEKLSVPHVQTTGQTKPPLQQQKRRQLYAGVLLGGDGTTIKGQSIRAAGYSAGLLAGYQLSNRLALETGILWDRKRYYSKGEYFNTNKIYLPSHAKIVWVDGYCDMLEIPVNLRWNWALRQHHQWFASAGLSSYLMKKEAYDYEYERYNQRYYYSKDYYNQTKNWFSVLNLSVGYQKSLGAVGRLRLEPYVKLPLKGLGIGSMPMTSTGVQIGITRFIK